MPQVYKLGSYWVYFWTNENNPTEPIHVHISEGKPVPHATKVWITKDGKCSLANNNSKLPVVVKYEVMPRILRLQFMEPQKTAESRA